MKYRSNIMEALGYYRADIQSVNLEWVEFTLAQAVASVYWRGGSPSRATNDKVADDDVSSSGHAVLG